MKLLSKFALSSFSLCSIISQTVAHPAISLATARAKQPLPLPVDFIHQFPRGTWVENLAVRSNGKVLVTLLSSPDLYQIDPLTKKDPVLVHHFSDHLGLAGIAELCKDIFYVVGGNYSFATNTNTPGAEDVYEVDITKGATKAKVTKIANFPKAILLDGMITLDPKEGLLLVADAGAGVLYRLNVKTKQVDVAIEDATMKDIPPSPAGINGIKVRDGALYFTNSALRTFVKIPIFNNGTAAGPAVILSTNVPGDDFTFDNRGDAFLADNIANNLGFLGPLGGNVTVLTGAPLTNTTLLARPTACQFGRLSWDKKTLYITTGGGVPSGTSTPRLGGTLSKVNLAGSGYYDKGS